MTCDPILSAERIRAMTAAGLWKNKLITDYLDEAIAAKPDQPAIIAHGTESGQRLVLTYAELGRAVERIALGLVKLGVQSGDMVSFQLPNWWQFNALYLACARIGAVANPLMPIFRQRELSYMLELAEAKVMIVPREFRGFDYPAMMAELRPKLPVLEHLFVVGGQAEQSFEAFFLDQAQDVGMRAAELFRRRRPSPNAVTQLLYTSGTTGQPKGGMHTANTLLCAVEHIIQDVGVKADDVCYMASPLAHQTGFLMGLLLPIVLQTRIVLEDIWNADHAWPIIRDEKVTFTMASTPFLADMTNSPLAAGCSEHFRTFVSGGAPIPRVLVKRAMETMNIDVLAVWGMTEVCIVTATRRNDPAEKVFGTDGRALSDSAVRVVDDQRRDLPTGQAGLLLSRCPYSFVGYLKRPELFCVDQDGWMDTGDIATLDEDGYIRICGRSKDILIRGGENIPVVEVEEAIYRHADVVDAQVVGIPDERLGERGCAFVVLKTGATMTLAQMQDYLARENMAKNYWPERLEVISAMPRTASGKIQKFVLREMAKGFASH